MKQKEEPRGLINLDLLIKRANKSIRWLQKRHKKKKQKIKERNKLVE